MRNLYYVVSSPPRMLSQAPFFRFLMYHERAAERGLVNLRWLDPPKHKHPVLGGLVIASSGFPPGQGITSVCNVLCVCACIRFRSFALFCGRSHL